jgi:hypothetical protein
VRVSQVAALRRFWQPQIMPDFFSPQTWIKPHENGHHSMVNAPFLSTLKPEEPIFKCAAYRLCQGLIGRPDSRAAYMG